MKIAVVAGFALIALGAIALVYQGITYTTRETVVDIGPIHATANREKTLPIPPVLGVALVLGGAVVLYTSGRRRVS
jgi:hypothetical protein